MSDTDHWNTIRAYDLYCARCGQVSQKSFIELEMSDRLPCYHCGISIKVANDYGPARLEAIAISHGSVGHILRQSKKSD